jgi:hypothetical protein
MVTTSLEMPNFVGHRSGRFNDNPLIFDSDHDGYSTDRIDQIADGGGKGSFWNAPPIEERIEHRDGRQSVKRKTSSRRMRSGGHRWMIRTASIDLVTFTISS